MSLVFDFMENSIVINFETIKKKITLTNYNICNVKASVIIYTKKLPTAPSLYLISLQILSFY